MKNDAKPSESAPQKSARDVDHLVELLGRIAATDEPAETLLNSFRDQYGRLPPSERPRLFGEIIRAMEVRKRDIEPGLHALAEGKETEALVWGSHLAELRQALESPRAKAFRQFVNLRGGLKFLLDLRVDILAAQRHGPETLRLLDQDIAQLFNAWFQQGFLFLQQITLDSSFRHIRFLQEHDMVHPMSKLEEMGSRLGEDRLCFALFHQSMPDEMVIFIEVALTQGIPRSIQEILGPKQSKTARAVPDTAIFYSINNTQNGLTGLGFGKLLIFQVVDAIRKSHPHIETFATLSPIPGFWDRYLKRILQGDDKAFAMKKKDLEALFPEKVRAALIDYYAAQTGNAAADVSTVLLDLLSGSAWIEDPQFVKWLEKPLVELAYTHVAREKGKPGRPLNPVANFHISNGATISRDNVNFAGNPAPRGLAESCGLMVNYIYSDTWRHQIRRTVKSLLPWKI